jgi:hypothetical protein
MNAHYNVDEELRKAGYGDLTEDGIKRNDRKYREHNDQLSTYQVESSDYYTSDECTMCLADSKASEQDLMLLDYRDFITACFRAGANLNVAVDWHNEMSLREIANDMGCSKSQARNILNEDIESIYYWLCKNPYWGLADIMRELFKSDYEERVVIR